MFVKKKREGKVCWNSAKQIYPLDMGTYRKYRCCCSTQALAQAVVFVSKFVANEKRRTDQVTYRVLGS